MKVSRFIRNHALGMMLLACVFAAPWAQAAAPALAGSYELVGRSGAGAHTKVVLRLHLTNKSRNPLYLEKVLLWDLGQPPKAGPATAAVQLRAGATEETTQEFTVPRLEYEQWQKGRAPRVVLHLRTPSGATFLQAIPLARTPLAKGK